VGSVRESKPVLLTRYFCFVGGALLALLLFVGWYWPGAPAQPSDEDAAASASIAQSIRIRSAQRWPEKVVIDTNVPTIVPPAPPPAPILAQARAAPAHSAGAPVEHAPADAHAEVRPDPHGPVHRRPVRVARHRYPRLRTSQFAYASPPTAPSWPFGW